MTGRPLPGPRLCPTCGYRMDPALVDVDQHMSCEANPGAVPTWRRRAAQKLRPGQLAGRPRTALTAVPNPTQETQ